MTNNGLLLARIFKDDCKCLKRYNALLVGSYGESISMHPVNPESMHGHMAIGIEQDRSPSSQFPACLPAPLRFPVPEKVAYHLTT